MSNFEKYVIRYGCVVLRTDMANVKRREVYLYEGNHIERGTLKFEQIEKFADPALIGSFNDAVKDERIQIIGIPYTKEISAEEANAKDSETLEEEAEVEVDSESEDVEKPTRRRKSSK